jgi:hypothetical protein
MPQHAEVKDSPFRSTSSWNGQDLSASFFQDGAGTKVVVGAALPDRAIRLVAVRRALGARRAASQSSSSTRFARLSLLWPSLPRPRQVRMAALVEASSRVRRRCLSTIS